MLVCSVHIDRSRDVAGGVPGRGGKKSGGLRLAGRRSGATLVELLTSLVVASILMVALMQSLAATSGCCAMMLFFWPGSASMS